MNEIERIVEIIDREIDDMSIANAMSQYVLKARIESVSKVMGLRSWEEAEKYVIELNKKLNQKKENK